MSAGPRARRRRWIVTGALAALVVSQFVPVDRSNPPVRRDTDAPADVRAILRRSCYDCHSNETRWPWYSRVAPVSWLVAHDVEEGRGEINFSEWRVADFDGREEDLRGIEKQIVKGEMPLRMYLWMHPDARLSDRDRATLLAWARDR